jgi:hypothetical protein
MINDLLEVTRMQAGKLTIELQSAPIAEAINYAVNTLQGAAEAKGIALSGEVGAESQPLPPVCADPMRLRQILIILVDNALKFTPANGVVKVRGRIAEGSPGWLLLEVSDTGCGVSPHLTERIFERLYQGADPAAAGRKGLGLGLYICKELVVRQGGRIWVENKPLGGAIFCVTLPIFSLPDMVDSIVRQAKRKDSPLSFIVAEVRSRDGWLSEDLRAVHAQGIRELLQRCLHSDLDVLLPKIGPAGDVELFCIVAVTDQIGGDAIIRRIHRRMDRSDYVQHAGLIVTTSYRLLGSVEVDVSEASPGPVSRMSGKIQEFLAQERLARITPDAA